MLNYTDAKHVGLKGVTVCELVFHGASLKVWSHSAPPAELVTTRGLVQEQYFVQSGS